MQFPPRSKDGKEHRGVGGEHEASAADSGASVSTRILSAWSGSFHEPHFIG